MNTIAYVFFAKYSLIFIKRGMFLRSIVELRLATIYTYHISIILHTHAHLDLIV
jgi:hypothetical protein